MAPGWNILKSSGGFFRDMVIHDFDMARFCSQPRKLFEVTSFWWRDGDEKITDIGDVDSC